MGVADESAVRILQIRYDRSHDLGRAPRFVYWLYDRLPTLLRGIVPSPPEVMPDYRHQVETRSPSGGFGSILLQENLSREPARDSFVWTPKKHSKQFSGRCLF